MSKHDLFACLGMSLATLVAVVLVALAWLLNAHLL